MELNKQGEALGFFVEFPKQNGVKMEMDNNLSIKLSQNIRSNILVKVGKATLATISYSEELTDDFALAEFEKRAKSYAQESIGKIIEATQKQAAHKMIITNDEVKLIDRSGATRVLLRQL